MYLVIWNQGNTLLRQKKPLTLYHSRESRTMSCFYMKVRDILKTEKKDSQSIHEYVAN